jgi:hypothetical protein
MNSKSGPHHYNPLHRASSFPGFAYSTFNFRQRLNFGVTGNVRNNELVFRLATAMLEVSCKNSQFGVMNRYRYKPRSLKEDSCLSGFGNSYGMCRATHIDFAGSWTCIMWRFTASRMGPAARGSSALRNASISAGVLGILRKAMAICSWGS